MVGVRRIAGDKHRWEKALRPCIGPSFCSVCFFTGCVDGMASSDERRADRKTCASNQASKAGMRRDGAGEYAATGPACRCTSSRSSVDCARSK